MYEQGQMPDFGGGFGGNQFMGGGRQMYPGGAGQGPAGPTTMFGPAPQGGQQAGGFFPTSQQMAGFQPLPYQDFGQVPFINPALIGGQDLAGLLPGIMQTNWASIQPELGQAQQGLDQQSASSGIFNSGARDYQQGNLLNQVMGNVLGQSLNTANQDVMANQQAQNAANAANAASYGAVTQGNENAYNSFLQSILGGGLGQATNLQNAMIGSFQPGALSGLLGQGMGQMGSAYSNAYDQAMQGSQGLGGVLGGALGSLFGPHGQTQQSMNDYLVQHGPFNFG